MIRVKQGTALTERTLAVCYNVWKQDLERLKTNDDLYTNKAGLKLPYAKKLTILGAAATLGDGIAVSPPDDLDDRQKKTFDEVMRLFKRQTIDSHDMKVINGMCKHGKAYELCFMSDDEVPIPKVAYYSALNAFVVYDDTVENNSVFCAWFSTYKTLGGQDAVRFYVADDVNVYLCEMTNSDINRFGGNVESVETGDNTLVFQYEHHMGRVPLTEVINNDETQSDFEQLIPAIRERTKIHNISFADVENIAKNYLKMVNVEMSGKTKQEKDRTQREMADSQRIGIDTKGSRNENADAGIISKNNTFAEIDVFGHDINTLIYSLALITDFSAEAFAGNISGVALRLKLLPLKELVKTKNGAIERLYRRRLKMYLHGILERDSTNFAYFDVTDCGITFNRSWTENEVDIAQIISMLQTTGLFSDRTLTNLMPHTDYDEEQAQLAIERENKPQPQDANNFSLEAFNALLRGENA